MYIIFLFLLIKRIKLKSDFGFPQIINNQSLQKGILGNQNVVALPNNEFRRNQINHNHNERSNNIEQISNNNIVSISDSYHSRLKNKKKKKNERKKRKKYSNKKNH